MSTTTNTFPKEILVPFYPYPVRAYHIAIILRPEPSFTLHQLSIQNLLQGLHNYQHSEAHPLIQIFGNKKSTTHIQPTSNALFPILDQKWRVYIEILSKCFNDPLSIVFPSIASCQLDGLKRTYSKFFLFLDAFFS